jgi:D-arabinose 1-dehydrogenase-like Zn-dependent alcohol dehydrogenase
MIMDNISLITTNQDTREELRAVLELVAQARIHPEYEVRLLGDIEQGNREPVAGKVKGRIVFRVASTLVVCTSLLYRAECV